MDPIRFRRTLLRWFEARKRPLPWRQTRDPYAIWISEVMLQQTTVAAVIPYFHRFLERFPTVEALAGTDEDAVLSLWSGLGYYSRARNLQHAARTLISGHAGRFPEEVATAMTLKGVGRYTASAVTSIAYGTPAAAVDGNVRRVLSRVHARRGITEGQAQDLADALLSRPRPGAWNEAMMELGATICTPTTPQCDHCPVARDCEGRDRPETWSAGKPRKQAVLTRVEMALVMRNGQLLLARTPPGSLMQGLLELPNSGLMPSSEKPGGVAQRHPGLSITVSPVAQLRHSITHHRIEVSIHKGVYRRRPADAALIFHDLDEVPHLPLGGMTRKALTRLGLLPPRRSGP